MTLINLLKTIIEIHLTTHAVNPSLISNLSSAIITNLTHQLGGKMVYIQQGRSEKIAVKHKQIISEFTGNNHSELSRQYKIALYWLKKLLARADISKSDSPNASIPETTVIKEIT